MAITLPTDKPLIAIYACGGTGYNLAAQFNRQYGELNIIRECVKIYFVDTSDSNKNEFLTQENTRVIGSGIGSGKKRAKNAEDIRDAIPTTLRAFQPGVFNVLLGGSSGGSGSTIINELFREMAIRKETCFNFLAGSVASRTEIENSDKCFTSFARICKRYDVPALVHYRENSASSPRTAVDANLVTDLSMLVLLLSGRDDKMDITDLKHFANFPEVTSFKPGVVGLEVFAGKLKLKPVEVLYAAATLAKHGESTDVSPLPEYQVAGYIRPEESEIFVDVSTLHWVVLGNTFTAMMKSLSEQVEIFKEQSAAHALDDLDKHGSEEDDDIVV